MSTIAIRNPRTLGSEPDVKQALSQDGLPEAIEPNTHDIQQKSEHQKSLTPDPSASNDVPSHVISQKRVGRKTSDPRMSVEMIVFGDRETKQTAAVHASLPSPSVASMNSSATPVASQPTLVSVKKAPAGHGDELSPKLARKPLARETLGARRRHIPKPLDVNALRRERQYSGPYSAAPLLTQNASYRSQKDNDTHPYFLSAPENESIESDPKKIRLPQMTPAPYVSSKLSHLQLPHCPPPPRARPSIPPAPVSPASTLLSPQPPKSMICGDGPHANGPTEKSGFFRNSRPRDISNWTPVSAHFDSKPRTKRALSQAFEESTINQSSNEKKARFMVLCEEMWNLFQE